MKIIKIVSLLVAILFVTLFLSPLGSYILKPYAHEYLVKKAPKDIDIKLVNFDISLSTLKADLIVNNDIKVNLDGNFSPISKNFDLKYIVQAYRFKISEHSIQDEINLKGKLIGNIDNFHVLGEGEALTSEVDYKFDLERQNIKNLSLNMKKGNIAKLLNILHQKNYSSGNFDMNLTTPILDTKNLYADINLSIKNAKLNEQLIYKEWEIEIPPKTTLQTKSQIQIEGGLIKFNTDINSSLGDLRLTKGNLYQVDQKNRLQVHYYLHSKDTAVLEPIIKRKIRGEIGVWGDAIYDDIWILTGETRSFGGAIKFTIKDAILNAKIDQASLSHLFYFTYYPTIIDARVNGNLNYNIKEEDGILNSKWEKIKFRRSGISEKIRKYTTIDLSKELFTDATFEADVNRKLLNFDFKAQNSTSHIYLLHSMMNKIDNTIHAKFDLGIKAQSLKGTILGDINNPKIELDIAKYIGNVIQEQLDTFISDDTKKKLKDSIKEYKNDDLDDLGESAKKIFNMFF